MRENDNIKEPRTGLSGSSTRFSSLTVRQNCKLGVHTVRREAANGPGARGLASLENKGKQRNERLLNMKWKVRTDF